MDGLSGQAVPYHHRLTLIGNGQRKRLTVGGLERQLTDGLHHIVVNLLSIVLHPSGLRIILLMRYVGTIYQMALLVPEHCLSG